MAVPQLASAGNAPTVKMLAAGNITQNQTNKLLQQLVDLTKTLVDGQTKMFQQLLLVLDQKAGETAVQKASGSVGETEEIPEEFSASKLFAGAFAALTLWSNELDKYIRTIFLVKALDNLTGLSTKIGNVFKAIGDVWKKKGTGQALLGETIKTLGKLRAPIQAIGDFFGRILKFLKPVTDTVKDVGSKIGKITKPIMGLFNSLSGLVGIGKTIGPFVKMAEKFAPLAKGILSKVLLPLFAIFDFISGFIEGFRSKGEDDTRGTMEKIFDGLLGGIKEMIKGIFIVPLDLLKDGVSWLAEKMGFEEFSKVLDSFSFTDLFDKMVTKIGEIINGIANWFGTLFTDPIQAIKDLLKLNVDIQMWILGKLASGLQAILNWVGELFSFKGDKKDEGLGDFISKKVKEFFEAVKLWIAETIPGGNKLLEMLGLGKVSERTLQEKKLADLEEEARTGTVLIGSNEKYRAGKAKEAAALREQLGLNNQTGTQLAADTQDVATKKEEKQAGATVVAAPSDNRDMRQTIIDSSTYMAPSPSSYPSDPNWDFE
jgi:hypothetical protein